MEQRATSRYAGDDAALTLETRVGDGPLRVALTGALVDSTAPLFRSWMQEHVPATARRLLLDLRGLTDVDAVGLGALLAAHRRLDAGAEVLVEGAPPAAARALRQAGLDQVLHAA